MLVLGHERAKNVQVSELVRVEESKTCQDLSRPVQGLSQQTNPSWKMTFSCCLQKEHKAFLKNIFSLFSELMRFLL